MTHSVALTQPLPLPCGQVLKNRLGKSAMSEALGTIDNKPTGALAVLYGRWAEGGIGLCITGNVMVDSRALGEPNNVVLQDDSELALLTEWAQAGTANGVQLWMQLNHPGKQTPKALNLEAVGPSAVPFGPALQKFFGTPRALTEPEILDLVARFGRSAGLAKRAGFTGVQIHGAHGYLVSQFLSAHHNTREDRWGGSLENRMRFVTEVYQAIRAEVGPEFAVGIKLNSADFQKGGFSEEESMAVIRTLAGLGIDLIEISGGTYEAPAMSGTRRKESTELREAYFLDFAEKVRAEVDVPLMVTGGFRSSEAIAAALASGALDVVGLARPLAVDPDFPNALLSGEAVTSPIRLITTGIKFIDRAGLAEVTWYARQLHRMGAGKPPKPDESALLALVKSFSSMGVRTFRSRRLRA